MRLPDRKRQLLQDRRRLDAGATLKIVGVKGEGKVTKEQWEGISQRLENKDMGPRECAVSILKILIPTGPTACRLPNHGIERYQREYETTKSSAWVEGGSGRNFYDEMLNEVKAQNPEAIL
jgi:hypothetical protein